MNRKTFFVLLISLFVFSALAIAVSAQGVFDALLSPFGRFDEVYTKFSFFIDTVIYLIIFLGLAKFALGKRFGKEGRAVVVGVGIVLALSLSLFSARAGFNIASFGPVAAIILMALMGYSVWVGIKSLEIEGVDNLTLAAIAYLLVYFGVLMAVPGAAAWINERVPVIGALLALLALGFTVYIIYKMGSFVAALAGVGGRPSAGGDGEGGPGGGDGEVVALTPSEENAAKKQKTNAKIGARLSMHLKRLGEDAQRKISAAFSHVAADASQHEIRHNLNNDVKAIAHSLQNFANVMAKAGDRARVLLQSGGVKASADVTNLEKVAAKMQLHIESIQKKVANHLDGLSKTAAKADFGVPEIRASAHHITEMSNLMEEIVDDIKELAVHFDHVNHLLHDLIVAAHK